MLYFCLVCFGLLWFGLSLVGRLFMVYPIICQSFCAGGSSIEIFNFGLNLYHFSLRSTLLLCYSVYNIILCVT